MVWPRSSRMLVRAALVLALAACSGGGGTSSGTSGTSPTDGGATTSPASTMPTTSPIPADAESLFAVLGPPDIFQRELHVLDGQQVLVESYTYAEIGQRFDVVGGLVVGNEAIDEFPDGTLLPLQYHVYEVWPGAMRADVESSLEGVDLTEIDGAALELPEGATVLGAPQLVIGLLDGVVIYVETFALVPDEAGEFEAYLAGSEP